ncbi:MAG: hypothetical protein WC720_05085 [Candidatus Shapirobacteria bacterium]|jgi:hypothetical protein
MEEINEIEHEKIRLKIEGLKASQEASTYLIDIALKDLKQDVSAILEQTTKTNGRVTQLESDYLVIRTLRKNKWLLLLLSIGVFKVYELIDLQWIYNKLITLF